MLAKIFCLALILVGATTICFAVFAEALVGGVQTVEENGVAVLVLSHAHDWFTGAVLAGLACIIGAGALLPRAAGISFREMFLS